MKIISNLLSGAWCVDWSLGLGHTCGSKNCLIRVVRFIKILYYNVDSPNAPKGAPRVFWLQVGWVNDRMRKTFFFFYKKKKQIISFWG